MAAKARKASLTAKCLYELQTPFYPFFGSFSLTISFSTPACTVGYWQLPGAALGIYVRQQAYTTWNRGLKKACYSELPCSKLTCYKV